MTRHTSDVIAVALVCCSCTDATAPSEFRGQHSMPSHRELEEAVARVSGGGQSTESAKWQVKAVLRLWRKYGARERGMMALENALEGRAITPVVLVEFGASWGGGHTLWLLASGPDSHLLIDAYTSAAIAPRPGQANPAGLKGVELKTYPVGHKLMRSVKALIGRDDMASHLAGAADSKALFVTVRQGREAHTYCAYGLTPDINVPLRSLVALLGEALDAAEANERGQDGPAAKSGTTPNGNEGIPRT